MTAALYEIFSTMDKQPHPKRVRESKPKVRSGCANCKLRRVKCDEGKPSCERCLKSKRDCDYPELQPIRRRGATVKPPRPKGVELDMGQQRHILPREPSAAFVGSDKDYALFQLFRDKLTRDLGGSFQLPFFTLLVLRECHSSDIVRDLALSIAGLSRSFRKATLEEKQDDYNYALVRQSRALSSLRRTLTSSVQQLRLAVIASALLYVCEIFQGHFENSKLQLQYGQRLLLQWRSSYSENMIGFPVDEELHTPFDIFEHNFKSYATMNPYHGLYSPHDVDPIITEPVPMHFKSFYEVGEGWGRCAFLVERFMRKTDHLKRTSPERLTHPDIIEECAQLRAAYERWSQIIVPPSADSPTHPMYVLLHAGLTTVAPILEASISMFECASDNYLDAYELAVGEIGTNLDFEGDEPQEYSKMNACTELGHSLFHMGSRCRDWGIRRRVIKILQDHPRTQGLIKFEVLVKVLDWVRGIEEDGLADNTMIPEEKRIRMHTLMWNPMGNSVYVECMQGPPDGRWIYHKAVLP